MLARQSEEGVLHPLSSRVSTALLVLGFALVTIGALCPVA